MRFILSKLKINSGTLSLHEIIKRKVNALKNIHNKYQYIFDLLLNYRETYDKERNYIDECIRGI